MTELTEALRQSDNFDAQRVGYWLAAVQRDLAAFIAPDCVDRRKELLNAHHAAQHLQKFIRDAKSSF